MDMELELPVLFTCSLGITREDLTDQCALKSVMADIH